MLTTQQKLESIHNRATRYELAAIMGERRVLIAYTGRRSRHGLLEACRKRGPQVVALTCPSGEELLNFDKKASNGATIGQWAIRFTGRTQRDAIMEGELPYVADVVTQEVR